MKHTVLVLIAVLALAATAQGRFEYFQFPDIKNDFCGPHINYQYCKCAFHNELCGSINSNQSAASTKVTTEFDAFVAGRVEAFARSCMDGGGIYSVIKRHCEYCENGKVRNNGVCSDPNDTRSVKEIYHLPDVPPATGSISVTPVGYVESSEGEFFVYSPGRGKWIGPVRAGLSLFQGDTLFTTANGRAQISFGGSSRFHVADRTQLTLPTTQRERGLLERGTLFIWDTIKRLANNEPFEVEGAHSITGRKGTVFAIEVGDGVDVVTVKDGIVEVAPKNNPTAKTTVNRGESAKATVTSVSPNAYDWDALLKKYDVGELDTREPVVPKTFKPIDPDAVNPTDAAYSGDLVGELPNASAGGDSTMLILIVVVILAAGGFVYWQKKNGKIKF